jgi:hypothetical protein
MTVDFRPAIAAWELPDAGALNLGEALGGMELPAGLNGWMDASAVHRGLEVGDESRVPAALGGGAAAARTGVRSTQPMSANCNDAFLYTARR